MGLFSLNNQLLYNVVILLRHSTVLIVHVIFPETLGNIENFSPNKIKIFSTLKKDLIVPESGTEAQGDNPNVQDPESGNLKRKIALS